LKNTIISIENLSKSYGWRNVLKNINLEVARGSRILLIEPNGAGKTTLIRIIAGLEKPDNGRVKVFGKIIYVPETSFAPLPARVKDWLELHDIRPDEISRLSRDCGVDLAPYINKPIAHLSKGMRRILELLTILFVKADIILLDEPFTGISPKVVYRLSKLLLDHFDRHDITMVITAHIYEGSSLLLSAEHVYILEDGVLREIRRTSKIVVEVFTIEGVKRIITDTSRVYDILSKVIDGLGKWVFEIKVYPGAE